MDEKMMLVEKYHLIHENNAWYSDRENSHKHLIFKDFKNNYITYAILIPNIYNGGYYSPESR